MFSKPIVSLGALVLATVATAKPIPAFKDILAKRGDSHSFDSYGGYGSMSNFDDFYGSSDFSGVSQTLVQNKDVVCHSEKVEIVQQQLAVIREWYKKIITEQICEVEVQTIVHTQFVSGCEGFSSDIRRKSSRDVSYDHNIASQISVIHDSNNECVTNNLGWEGTDIGSNAVSYSGDNWNSQYSPSNVDSAYGYCQQSYGYSSPSYSSSWSSSYTPPSYGSSGYGSYGSYVPPSYDNTYVAPPTYTYDSSYGSGYSYEAPPPTYTYDSSYGSGYSYVAPPPSYTYGSSYGSGYSYVAPPPTYTSASYGYGYEAPPSDYSSVSSYGYGYVPPSESSGYYSPDISGNSTECDSCGPSSDVIPSGSAIPVPTDPASAPIPTDSSVATDSSAATGTAVASDAVPTVSASASATDSAATSSAPAASASASSA